MKKQLLLIVLLVSIGVIYGAKKINIDFAKTKNFTNVPATGLEKGDTITITNIDPKVFSPGELKDAAGNVWAKKTGVVYPYGGGTVPRPGTATFTVKAIPIQAAPITKRKALVPEIPGKVIGKAAELPEPMPPVPPRREEPTPTKPKPTPEIPGKVFGKPTELPEPMPAITPPVPPMPPADGRPEEPLRVYQKITGKATYATPYEILKVPESATQDQIKKAWKNQILFWHPDRNNDPDATNATTLINWAYNFLKIE